MTACFEKSCLIGLPCVYFVDVINLCVLTSLLVFRMGCGIVLF